MKSLRVTICLSEMCDEELENLSASCYAEMDARITRRIQAGVYYPALTEEEKNLLGKDRIACIKKYQTRTNYSLRVAKKVVDHFSKGI